MRSYFPLHKLRSSLLVGVAALAVAVPAMPQSQTPSNSSGSDYPTFEVGVFGGGQWFRDKGVKKFNGGPLVGFRFDEYLATYFGLEESLTAGFNQLELLPWGENAYTGFSERNYQLAVNPMFYLDKPESRIRPFLTVGPDYFWYKPTAPPPFKEVNTPALLAGAGFKARLADNVSFRFDGRWLWTRQPHFGLPNYGVNPGDLYVPAGGTEKDSAVYRRV